MAKRSERAKIAQETVEILERGTYEVQGRAVSLADKLAAMRSGTKLYTPDMLEALVASLPPTEPARSPDISDISVHNCTTFAAAKSLLDSGHPEPLCLNFASARNPGGGFLSGSQAQEECLARASGLYASLLMQPAYYERNREHDSSLYTNHLIYSPHVPVFRDDKDVLLPQPYAVSLVTSPAVNARAVRDNEPHNVPRIQSTMENRIRTVLAVARQHQHRALVLGAWGCGVFGNDPRLVAQWFAAALEEPPFAQAFDRVVFAVLDFAVGTPTFQAFREVFS